MTGVPNSDPLDRDLDPWLEAFDRAFHYVPHSLYDEEQKPAERALADLLKERRALVEVARAARALIADREGANIGEERLALRAALARLDGAERPVFPAGGSSAGQKNLSVAQPGKSQIMRRALEEDVDG